MKKIVLMYEGTKVSVSTLRKIYFFGGGRKLLELKLCAERVLVRTAEWGNIWATICGCFRNFFPNLMECIARC
jgi:hypothetical protein